MLLMEGENEFLMRTSPGLGPSVYRRFLLCIFMLKFTEKFISAFIELPAIRLFEAAVCREYYQGQTVSKADGHATHDCKIPEIQNAVAMLLGVKVALDTIPGFAMSLWYGALTNRCGRRAVLALSALGGSLSWGLVSKLSVGFRQQGLRPQYLWVGSLFYFIGGGERLFLGMIFTACTDVVPQYRRSQIFFRLHAISHVARLLAPPLASLLMTDHLLLIFLVAHLLMMFRLVLIMFLPETVSPAAGLSESTVTAPVEHSAIIDHSVASGLESSTIISIKRMLCNNGLAFLFVAYVLKRVAFASEGLSFQYASSKMDVALYVTTWLRTLNVMGAISAVMFLLPVLGKAGTGLVPEKDRLGMRWSLAIATLGFFVIFLSRTFLDICIGMTIAGMAEGLEPCLQALGTYIVGTTRSADLFTFMSILDLVGQLTGGPLMAVLYSIHSPDGSPAGYPFLFATIMFMALFAGSHFTKIRNMIIE